MLYKTTLKLLVVSTPSENLLVPIVHNSYKQTLWLLKHREPDAEALGTIEGAFEDINFNIGPVNLKSMYNQILTDSISYTTIGKQPDLPDTYNITKDLTMPLEEFILKYNKIFTPDGMLVVLGISHTKLFKLIGELVLNKKIKYKAESGPNKWSFYDYFWLHEKYSVSDPSSFDIRPIINRNSSQIKFRAHSIKLSKKDNSKKIVKLENIKLGTVSTSHSNIELSDVDRDYMITQIHDTVALIASRN